MIYWLLFIEFLKTGLFTIGGGLATLPFLQKLTEKYTWFTAVELVDMIAISESTPGPIGINMATFAGYKAGGILGGVIASFAVALPGMIIAILVARILKQFKDNQYVKAAFKGIRPAVAALIMVAGWSIIRGIFFKGNIALETLNIKAVLWFAFILLLVMKFKKHPIVYIALSAMVGIIISF